MNKFYLQKCMILLLCPQSFTLSLMASQNNQSAVSIIKNRTTQYQLSPALMKSAKDSKVSILMPTADQEKILYKNYPKGALLFPGNSDLANQFDTVISSLQTNPKLIPFMRKIQISVLNNLYDYFLKIYTNFNLTHPGSTRKDGTIVTDVLAYYQDEEKYQTSIKDVMMNSCLDLIQSQFSQSIVSYVPTTPVSVATPLGKMFIANDFTINLDDYLTPQKDPAVIQTQQNNINFMKQYLTFMQNYTQYLGQNDSATGFNKFASMAQSINNYLPKMNPNMFFYDATTMQAIQSIPGIIGSVKSSSQQVPFAPDIVDAAINKKMMNGQPLAYFVTADGNKTQNQAQAKKLFLLMQVQNDTNPAGFDLFEQELLAQPSWLQSTNDMIKILQACLGNFAAIIDMNILDSTLEKVIKKIAASSSNDDLPPPPPSIPLTQ